MGCILGSPSLDAAQDSTVRKELAQSKKQQAAKPRLLLLGSGGSGKSTFFKQLQFLYGEQTIKLRERMSFVSQIHEQIITQAQLLIEKCDEWSRNRENYEYLALQPESQRYTDILMRLPSGASLNPEIAEAVTTLWNNDPAFRHGYELRAQLCIYDTTSYFFDNIARIVDTDFEPTDEDLLSVRHRTTGMNEKDFELEPGHIFTVVDVGGQRSERRKWVHLFEGITGVLFVASLSCYDEVLYEDESMNVMHETLNVFEETCNLHWFEESALILFLNKDDLFREKIQTVDMNCCFEDYTYGCDYEAAINYLQHRFEALNRLESRPFYMHVTTAKNKDNVRRVFRDVQQIIAENNLKKSGLLMQ